MVATVSWAARPWLRQFSVFASRPVETPRLVSQLERRCVDLPNARVWRKDILREGSWMTANGPWVVTTQTLHDLAASLENQVSSNLDWPALVVDLGQKVAAVVGRVIGLAVAGDTLWALVATADPSTNARLEQGAWRYASLSISEPYEDRGGVIHPLALLQVGIVEHPMVLAQTKSEHSSLAATPTTTDDPYAGDPIIADPSPAEPVPYPWGNDEQRVIAFLEPLMHDLGMALPSTASNSAQSQLDWVKAAWVSWLTDHLRDLESARADAFHGRLQLALLQGRLRVAEAAAALKAGRRAGWNADVLVPFLATNPIPTGQHRLVRRLLPSTTSAVSLICQRQRALRQALGLPPVHEDAA